MSTLGHEGNSGAARASACDVQESAGTSRQSHHAASFAVSSSHPAIRCRKWLELKTQEDSPQHEAVVVDQYELPNGHRRPDAEPGEAYIL